MPTKLILTIRPWRAWCSPGSDRKQTIKLSTHRAGYNNREWIKLLLFFFFFYRKKIGLGRE